MADIRDGIIIRTFFLFASFSVPSFLASFKRFWSNETGKGSLSKVVQRVRNYLQLNFQKDWSSTSEVMANFCDSIIIITSIYYPHLCQNAFQCPLSALSYIKTHFADLFTVVVMYQIA